MDMDAGTSERIDNLTGSARICNQSIDICVPTYYVRAALAEFRRVRDSNDLTCDLAHDPIQARLLLEMGGNAN